MRLILQWKDPLTGLVYESTYLYVVSYSVAVVLLNIEDIIISCITMEQGWKPGNHYYTFTI